MTTYTIDIEGDVLKVGFTSQHATGDVVVKDAVARLDEMIKSGELGGGELIKINGRASVLVSQVLADKLAPLYKTIAFFDPKIGDKGLDRYVVTISKNPKYKAGDILEIRRQEKRPNIKVAICGFANTGKTCFREGLKQALQEIPQAPESYFISACPDGDGSWFLETAKCDGDLANKLKAEYKAKFTEEFAHFKAQEIRGISEAIFVFDVGGKISKENEIIMAEATHGVILVKDEQEISDWENFCNNLGLQVIAIIFSDYYGKEDFIESETPILRGRVHRLVRGEDVSGREMIKVLAKVLVGIYRG
jgi:CRISPR-associated protein Csx3